MAAVSIPPSPHAIGIMASRRHPLADIPNGGNSPYRPAVTPVKRSRSHSNVGENTPPNKRQLVDEKIPPRTPTRKVAPARSRPQGERQIVGRTAKQDRGETDTQSLETVLQWQRHYRKIFPSYVFYFENIPEEQRRRLLKGIESLGAREVKFFSKDVTHVITTRSIPSDTLSNADEVSSESASHHSEQQPKTINPSLLDRTTENGVPRAKFNFDLANLRRGNAPLLDISTRKPVVSKVDILQKAQELGIKIWQLEKLWRILKTIFDDSQEHHGHGTRNNAAGHTKTTKQMDLSQMIRNEQIHERGEREMNTATTELVKLSGPYLYVRDMNEKTKPILIREYPRVERKEDGEWPQFRSASSGKCPFVEEEAQLKKQKEYREEKARRAAEAQAKAKAQVTVQTRAQAIMQPPIPKLGSSVPSVPNGPITANRQSVILPPPPGKDDSTFINGSNGGAEASRTRLIGGEPVASGVQPSNITSAIRSQMISSTAAAPGAKAGTSREIHGLQRKVFERNTQSGPGLGLHHSQRMTNIAGSVNQAVVMRRAQREPAPIKEEEEELEPDSQSRPSTRASERIKNTLPVKEGKPGYCENCREKFEDFDTHVQTRKHRKFASDVDNWRELDQLLSRLERPLKNARIYDDENDEQ